MSQYVSALNASERFLEARPGVLSNALRLVVLALRIRTERRQLARLSDAALADIGITRAQAMREASRPLTDIPAHRRGGLYL
ncbi:MAG: DUF1127 domain-containing protein [Rhodospirillales bacterium]|nr:DUF1127 domain-containing protein [Rhodospirillales bacterium]MBO6787313.1 DUF1127 domain-containing protein [Rhodospirillales bacterium]